MADGHVQDLARLVAETCAKVVDDQKVLASSERLGDLKTQKARPHKLKKPRERVCGAPSNYRDDLLANGDADRFVLVLDQTGQTLAELVLVRYRVGYQDDILDTKVQVR